MDRDNYGTVDEYEKAIRKVEKSKRMKLLLAHFRSHNHTATWKQIAQEVGYENFNAVNLNYGKLAEKIARQLGQNEKLIPRNHEYAWWLYVLVDWANPSTDHNDITRFVLRPEVVKALTRLGYR